MLTNPLTGSNRPWQQRAKSRYRKLMTRYGKLAALDALCGFGYTESFNSSGKTR
jgi:hypothetical protein